MNFLWSVLLMILILITLIFPLLVLMLDFHTHCFQLVCGTTLAWLALALSPFSPLSPPSSLISHNSSLSFNSQLYWEAQPRSVPLSGQTLPIFFFLFNFWGRQAKETTGKNVLKLLKLLSFESDLLKTNEDIAPQSREILQAFAWHWGPGTNLHVHLLKGFLEGV